MSAHVVDWTQLRRAAVEASRHAYVPYSRFPVGVAALTTAGRVVTGCNVENAAYGVALCAECGLVSSLVNSGGSPPGRAPVDGASDGAPGGGSTDSTASSRGPVVGLDDERERLVALSCVDGNGTPITPCGRCRQLLHEHALPPGGGEPGLLVEMAEAEPLPLTALLPHAFGAPNLGAVASSAETLKGVR